jgi:hypothetical protein
MPVAPTWGIRVGRCCLAATHCGPTMEHSRADPFPADAPQTTTPRARAERGFDHTRSSTSRALVDSADGSLPERQGDARDQPGAAAKTSGPASFLAFTGHSMLEQRGHQGTWRAANWGGTYALDARRRPGCRTSSFEREGGRTMQLLTSTAIATVVCISFAAAAAGPVLAQQPALDESRRGELRRDDDASARVPLRDAAARRSGAGRRRLARQRLPIDRGDLESSHSHVRVDRLAHCGPLRPQRLRPA